MALTTNKIDQFQFIALQGQVLLPVQAKVIADRPGVDGSEFILTGKKGKPFTLVSQADEESYLSALELLPQYQALIEGDAVKLTKGGVDYDTLGCRFVVLDVQEISCLPITGASGYRLSTNSNGFLAARWDLIAVPFTAS